MLITVAQRHRLAARNHRFRRGSVLGEEVSEVSARSKIRRFSMGMSSVRFFGSRRILFRMDSFHRGTGSHRCGPRAISARDIRQRPLVVGSGWTKKEDMASPTRKKISERSVLAVRYMQTTLVRLNRITASAMDGLKRSRHRWVMVLLIQ